MTEKVETVVYHKEVSMSFFLILGILLGQILRNLHAEPFGYPHILDQPPRHNVLMPGSSVLTQMEYRGAIRMDATANTLSVVSNNKRFVKLISSSHLMSLNTRLIH